MHVCMYVPTSSDDYKPFVCLVDINSTVRACICKVVGEIAYLPCTVSCGSCFWMVFSGGKELRKKNKFN
jgi:hypothetical protein